MIDEFEANEIWSDIEYGYCRLLGKEFVESKHYFSLRQIIIDFIKDNQHLDDGVLKPLKDAVN